MGIPDDPARPSKLKDIQLERARSEKVIWGAQEGAWVDLTLKIAETTSSAELWRKIEAGSSGKNRAIKVKDSFISDADMVACQQSWLSMNVYTHSKCLFDVETSFSGLGRLLKREYRGSENLLITVVSCDLSKAYDMKTPFRQLSREGISKGVCLTT